ncbi:MAG: Unknown protein [uncultured Campylobacterales bacterium]|uniref:Transglycosylase SLT domain-containing protein n=1 Tax=uncultured Campylobacterales bacterium TaxID=352960 RepID=A0A6S6SBI5_9BACT|nr:MAG: Unknown protein [uncultured Campylobacterales bacterium]
MLTLLAFMGGAFFLSSLFKGKSLEGMGKVNIEEESEIDEEELLYNIGDQASEENDDAFANTDELSEEETQDLLYKMGDQASEGNDNAFANTDELTQNQLQDLLATSGISPEVERSSATPKPIIKEEPEPQTPEEPQAPKLKVPKLDITKDKATVSQGSIYSKTSQKNLTQDMLSGRPKQESQKPKKQPTPQNKTAQQKAQIQNQAPSPTKLTRKQTDEEFEQELKKRINKRKQYENKKEQEYKQQQAEKRKTEQEYKEYQKEMVKKYPSMSKEQKQQILAEYNKSQKLYEQQLAQQNLQAQQQQNRQEQQRKQNYQNKPTSKLRPKTSSNNTNHLKQYTTKNHKKAQQSNNRVTDVRKISSKGLKRLNKYEKDVIKASNKYNLDKNLVKGLMYQESIHLAVLKNKDEKTIKSSAGAVGVMQFMPPTARDMNLVVNDNTDERTNSSKAINAGGRYLSILSKRYNGNNVKALAAYNWGMGNVDNKTTAQILASAPLETRKYISRVLGYKAFLDSQPDNPRIASYYKKGHAYKAEKFNKLVEDGLLSKENLEALEKTYNVKIIGTPFLEESAGKTASYIPADESPLGQDLGKDIILYDNLRGEKTQAPVNYEISHELRHKINATEGRKVASETEVYLGLVNEGLIGQRDFQGRFIKDQDGNVTGNTALSLEQRQDAKRYLKDHKIEQRTKEMLREKDLMVQGDSNTAKTKRGLTGGAVNTYFTFKGLKDLVGDVHPISRLAEKAEKAFLDTAEKIARKDESQIFSWYEQKEIQEEASNKVLTDLSHRLEQSADKIYRSSLSKEATAEYEKVQVDMAEASGVIDIIEANWNLGTHLLKNAKSWSLEGTLAGTSEAALPGVVGFKAAAKATTLLSKIKYGMGSGAIHGVTVDPLSQFSQEIAKGEDYDKALELTLKQIPMSIALGASIGSVGGAISRNRNIDTAIENMNDASNPLSPFERQLVSELTQDAINTSNNSITMGSVTQVAQNSAKLDTNQDEEESSSTTKITPQTLNPTEAELRAAGLPANKTELVAKLDKLLVEIGDDPEMVKLQEARVRNTEAGNRLLEINRKIQQQQAQDRDTGVVNNENYLNNVPKPQRSVEKAITLLKDDITSQIKKTTAVSNPKVYDVVGLHGIGKTTILSKRDDFKNTDLEPHLNGVHINYDRAKTWLPTDHTSEYLTKLNKTMVETHLDLAVNQKRNVFFENTNPTKNNNE